MKRPIIHNNRYVYTRIDKRVARRLYNEGYIIAIIGMNQRADNCIQICKDFNNDTFDTEVNAWNYYHGTIFGRPAFYIETPEEKK